MATPSSKQFGIHWMHFRMDRRCRDGDCIDGGGKPEATGGGARGARGLPLANAPAKP